MGRKWLAVDLLLFFLVIGGSGFAQNGPSAGKNAAMNVAGDAGKNAVTDGAKNVAGYAVRNAALDAAKNAAMDDSVLIRQLADTILTDSKAYMNLRTLTKTVGARLSGSAGFYKAEVWGQQALTDAQADRVWLQECMVPHWVRGGRDSAALLWSKGKAVTQYGLDILALGNSVGTDRGAAEGGTDMGAAEGGTMGSGGGKNEAGGGTKRAEGNAKGSGGNAKGSGGSTKGILAPVMMVRSFDELERRKEEVRGKIVFYNYPFNPLFVETFQAYSDAVRYRGAGASRAAKYGAVGVLVRSMSSSVDNNPHTGSMNYNDSFPKIPAAAVGLRDADRLASDIAHNTASNLTVYLRTGAHMLPDTLAHNVIAELKGSVFPDQYITVGGHLDSWDPAEGAQDDGAGCVQSIEVLRALKAIGYKPRHTIRVVLFANEENGGRGGKKYAAAAKENHETHLLGLESDNGGFTPRAFTLSLPEEKLAGLRGWVKLLEPYGVTALVHGGGGSDVNPLRPQVGAVVGELRPDSQRYFDYHHSRADVLENVNKRELELGTVNMAALVYLVDKYGF